MEDLLPSEIARLVLGYLKEEKCHQSYNYFLQNSEHLKECYEFSKRGRHFSTKVMGKSLNTILDEYCKMCSLVQEHLKKCTSNDSLETNLNNPAEQLRFLLESIEATSPTQTMLLRVTLPGSSSRANRLQQKNKSDRSKRAVAHVAVNEIDNGNEGSAEDEVDAPADLDVNATPLHSLPGHDVSKDESVLLKSRRKSSLHKKIHSNSESVSECSEEVLNLNVVQKALLDNKELHEKIAENINKVINTPETSINPAASSQNESEYLASGSGIDKELNSIIKTIVKQTENDPVFEKLLDGIVAEAEAEVQEPISEDSDEKAQNWSENSTPQRSNSMPREYFQPRRRLSNDRSLSDLRKVQKRNGIPFRPALKTSKKSQPESRKQDEPPTSKIDDQNAEAIQSIIEMTQKCDVQKSPQNKTNSTTKENQAPTEPDTSTSNTATKIISVEGKIETVTCVPAATNPSELTSDTSTTSVPPNSNYIVMTPNIQTTQSTFIVNQDNTVTVPSINPPNITPSVILLQPAPNIYNTSNPVTQIPIAQTSRQPINTDPQDILQMPVIMYTDNMIDPNFNQKRIPTLPKKRSRYREILPNYNSAPISIKIHPAYTAAAAINAQELSIPKDLPPIEVTSPVPLATVTTNTVVVSSNTTTTTATTSSTGEKQIFEADSNTQTDEEREKSKDSQEITPVVTSTNTTQYNHVRLSMSTPRSGRSHIRALDFSTPSKYDNPRKANTSPKNKTDNTVSTPKSFSYKLEPIPKSASLFRTDEPTAERSKPSIPIATRTPTTKPIADWDGVNLILQEKKSPGKITEKKRSRSLSESDVSPEQLKPKKKPFSGDWDADLRSLITQADINMKSSPQPKKKFKKDDKEKTSESNKKYKKANMKKTENKKLNTSGAGRKRRKKRVLTEIENKRITRSVSKKAESKLLTTEPKITRRERKRKSAEDKTKCLVDAKEEEDAEVTSENYEVWINKGITAKYHKKCNATNVLADDATSQVTIQTINNTIIVETQNATIESTNVQTHDPLMSSTTTKKESDAQSNFNPDINKDDILMSSSSRNLLPYLETPSKEDFSGIPITPRFMTPSSLETPLTKMIREQTEIISNTLIPTPSISFTPLFAITPKSHDLETPITTYQSRQTDYSSCSSYYVPSDDQNRELEQTLINECLKYENKKEQANQSANLAQPEQNTNDPTKLNDDENSSSSSSSSNSSSNSSFSSSLSSNSSSPSVANQTVLCAPTKLNEETLKSNKTITPRKSNTPNKKSATPTPTKSPPNEKILHTHSGERKFKTELEQKRKRTVVKIKEDTSKKRSRGRPAKFPKSPPKVIEKVPRKRGRKPKATLASLLNSRRIRSREREKKIADDFEKNDEFDFPSLHISSDEENIEDTFEKTIQVEKKSPITESDTEKRSAIEFLKERGILLVPNKKNKYLDNSCLKITPDPREDKQLEVPSSTEINKEILEKKIQKNPEQPIKEHSNLEITQDDDKTKIDIQKNDSNDPKDQVLDEDSKDSSASFNLSTSCNEISIQYEGNDSPPKIEDLDKPKEIVELEFVVEDITKVLRVTPYVELLDLPARERKPRKRIVRRISTKSDKIERKADSHEPLNEINKENPQKCDKPRPLDVLYNEVTDVSNDTILSGGCSPRKENFITKNIRSDFDKKEDGEQSQLLLDTSLEEGECPDSNDEDESIQRYTVSGLSPKKIKFTRCKDERKRATPERSKSTDTFLQPNKKIKQNNPQQLLLNLDVESFLTQVHGPDN